MAVAAHLHDVYKTYHVGVIEVPAIRGVSLDIEAGTFLSLAGPSGSGKTTLLNLIGVLDEPDTGSIEIDGQPLEGLTSKDLADFRNTHLGFVFQTFNLIPVLTAFENIEFPLHLAGVTDAADRRERVESALEDVGLAGLSDRRPNELSGGQQQRVAVARALVKNPTLVLADEPTANLDSVTASEIMNLMKSMNEQRGTTFVFSTHDPLVMEHASRLVLLRDGMIESDERKGGNGHGA